MTQLSGQALQSGTIRGFVMDTSNAVVPGATVTISTETRLITRTAQTGGDGGYLFQSLPPGGYEIQVESPGFARTIRREIELRSGDNLRIDLELQPAAVGTTVEVRSEAVAALNTVNANINKTIAVSEFRDLLLPANEVTKIAQFLPGAVNEWSINGRPGSQISLQVDGANDGDEFQTGGNWQFNPPPEAIAEFRVTPNSYTTDLGRSSGARMEMVTRGGSNQFHGSVFGFLRNEKFNAKNWGSTTRPQSRYRYVGYTLGGPIKKERIFFFWTNYYRHTNNPSAGFRTFPTQAQLTGDFSAWLNPGAGRTPRSIKNPLAGGQLFPGNIIPASMLNRNALAYLNLYYPAVSDPFALANNSYTSSPVTVKDNYYAPRIDFRITDKWNMFVRLMHNEREEWLSYVNPAGKMSPDAQGYGGPSYSISSSGTYLISPRFLLDYQANFNKTDGPWKSKFPDAALLANIPDWSGKVLYPDANHVSYLPHITLSSGYTTVGRAVPRANKWSMGNVAGNFSWQGAKHNIKFGGDQVYRVRIQIENTDIFGTFTFDGSSTNDSLADLLLGRAYRFTQNSQSEYRDMRCYQTALYVMDEVRLGQKLTITMGLRWETDPPYSVKRGLQFSRFVPAMYDPSKAHTVHPTTGIITSAPNHLNGMEVVKAGGDTPMRNFAPRVSFAYAPWGNRTSIRAGYGFFYDHQLVSQSRLLRNPPLSFSATLFNTEFNDPSGGRLSDPRPLTIAALQIPFVTPRTQKYSAGVQHEFGPVFVDVSYVGAFSTQQRVDTNVNQPAPSLDLLQKKVHIDAIRPFYGFGPINMGGYGINTRYDSLQVEVKRGLRHGLFLQAAYTLSSLTQSGDGIDPRNYAYGAGHNNMDRRQILRLMSTWEPQFFARMPALPKTVLHGWQLSGTFSALTGQPLSVFMQTDTAGIGRTVRADWKGSADMPRTMASWFDASAFSAPAALAFGNSPVDAFYGPGSWTWDMGIFRNFQLRESMKLQYRFEAYNMPNHFNLNNPGTSFGTANFGRVVGKSGPRNLQMGLKILF